MDKAAHGVRRHDAQQPQENQDDGKCLQHIDRLLLDFMANHATHSSAAQCAGCAATGQDGATHGPHTCANGGVPFLLRHAGASGDGQTGEDEQGGAGGSDQGVKCFHEWLLMAVDGSLIKCCAGKSACMFRRIKIKDM
jgi:hypothetical protein